jgi:hypothetical protein
MLLSMRRIEAIVAPLARSAAIVFLAIGVLGHYVASTSSPV